ncbi:hypothetical protein SAMD00019534_043090 [Acytostelium subglobosum LB1]|uniref:hypothetical protein n=1 Tax=Acytostelium subglobosum LB1 TaxID=1410327 RepID=UPI000644BFEE|nr:hypothetical protein SAMD00019534_043090 [Acytostelium subglobosum LB1]GAM21134.1 hypothetical protein SAMD00019534_043090 [Acytostelium subglobosum LB1]|eukprot:XP_012756268.1 hypothetical protein SAMD00019534_043090 [Acytostelium subglobosum LB1]
MQSEDLKKDMNIGLGVGISTLVVGIVLTITGFVFSPVTGGTSLVSTGAGVLMITGGTVGVGIGSTAVAIPVIKFNDIKKLINGLNQSVDTSLLYKAKLTHLKDQVGLKEMFLRALSNVEPNGYICLICREKLRNPVYTLNGRSVTYYCYDCLEKALDKNPRNPLTRAPMVIADARKCTKEEEDIMNKYEVTKRNIEISEFWK